uniref:Uncharacterized protein n=1 Tax=Plectus sambesii TaxID=2011161 RepID=A0A914W8E6_9BILA
MPTLRYHAFALVLQLFLFNRKSLQIDVSNECRFAKLAQENVPDLDYSQELNNLITGTDHTFTRNDSARQCAVKSFLIIETHFKNLGTQIDSSVRDIQLKATIREARALLNKVQHVFLEFQALKTVSQSNASANAVRDACRSYKPKDLIHELSSISSRFPSLFQELVEGTGFSLQQFNSLARGILQEAAMCALLAIECIRWIDSSVDEGLEDHYRHQITQRLNEIEMEYDKAGRNLLQHFPHVVHQDLQRLLQFTTDKAYNSLQSVNYIYRELSKKFFFMEWFVMQYDHIPPSFADQHAHENASSRWFYVSNHDFTVIAHATDVQEHCAWFGNRVKGKTVKQLFADDQKYASFVEDSSMSNAISKLKEVLLPLNLPQNHVFSVVKYRMDLKVAYHPNMTSHFYENVRLSNNGGVVKHAFIGWC